MSRLSLLYTVCLVCFIILLTLNLTLHYNNAASSQSSILIQKDGMALEYARLLEVLKVQNATIHSLESMIDQSTSPRSPTDAKPQTATKASTDSSPLAIHPQRSNRTPSLETHPHLLTNEQTECEARYGLQLIESWANSKQTWCSGNTTIDGVESLSELTCYPYHQKHKQTDGRGKDLFCEATNIFIDFSKVRKHMSASIP